MSFPFACSQRSTVAAGCHPSVDGRQPAEGLRAELWRALGAGLAMGIGIAFFSTAASAYDHSGCHGPSRREIAKTDAKTLVQVIETWKLNQSGPTICPSVDRLKDEGALRRDQVVQDPWHHDYYIRCSGDDVAVFSGGEDGVVGTDDDVISGAAP